MLTELCEELVRDLDAVGCIISRVIGDVLVQIAEAAPDGRSYEQGRGYLVSEFPETAKVLETGVPVAVSATDDEPDPAEVAVLRELGVGAVLMLALRVGGEPWGLVEVYRDEPRTFAEDDAARAGDAIARTAARLHGGPS